MHGIVNTEKKPDRYCELVIAPFRPQTSVLVKGDDVEGNLLRHCTTTYRLVFTKKCLSYFFGKIKCASHLEDIHRSL